MKKIAVFLSVLSLLAASGCSNAENAAESDTSAETNFSIIVEDLPETTAAPTDQPTEAPTTASSTETETFAADTTAASETTDSATPATALTETAAPESMVQTVPTAQDTAGLLGVWEYADGYRFRFMEENAMEMQLNYSGIISFSGEQLNYDGKCYTPVVENENIFVKQYDGTTLLHLTALKRENGLSFDGRYRLEDCQFYQLLTEGYTDRPAYEIEVEGGAFRVIADGEYHASEDGILELVQNGSLLKLQYILQGASLTIIDETGAQDILKRVG